MRRLAATLALLCSMLSVFGQEGGTVSGVVISAWDGSPIQGVAVTVRGTTLAAQTDQNGRYEVKNVPPGDQVLRFSKSGFASATVTDVRVLTGQSSTVNGNLKPEFFEMEEYEVTAEEFTEQTEKILFERQQSGSMLEAVGSEQFSRLGASDAGAIVGRVTGVSIVGGKYAVVRGLSDRYIRTQLNGLEVPSSDPYRTAPQLDLFPSSMIDRISISKTFTPDQPGATAGGLIDIITKPFPDKRFIKFSAGVSYNANANLKDDFLADPKSKMGWSTFPSGPRGLPEELWSLTNPPTPPFGALLFESMERATTRKAQADAVSNLMRALGVTDFAGERKDSPLNSTFNVSMGDTVKLAGRDLGIFGGANYARGFRQLNAYPVARYSAERIQQRRGTETRANIITDQGANVNLGYRLSDNHEIGFNFMQAHNIDEEARETFWDFIETQRGSFIGQRQLHYTDRQIFNYQLHGEHHFPELFDSHFDWAVSLAETAQNEPNHRFLNFFADLDDGEGHVSDNALPIPFNPSRYYRTIDDESRNLRLDWTIPITVLPQESKFKMGMLNNQIEREFREQYFGYKSDPNEVFDPNQPNNYLNDPSLFDYNATRFRNSEFGTNYTWRRIVEFLIGRPYTASQQVMAGYQMVDLGVLPWLRLIGGVRAEQTTMLIQTRDAGSSEIYQTDFLPSAGAVITPMTNLNLRLAYSGTVARPSFREKAPISNYLPDLDLFADGYADLNMSYIESWDARMEWFPTPGDVVSIGGFYKSIEHPIELMRIDIDASVSWTNRASGRVAGIEFEARKDLGFITDDLKGLSLGLNMAYIKSETSFTREELFSKTNAIFQVGSTRPLYDQSPYIINTDLSYDHPKWGTSLTIAANLTGERIILTTAQGPDIYEHSPISLDAQISQRFAKHFTFRFGVRNILDPRYQQTYGNKFDDQARMDYRRGRTFSIGITADF